MLLKYFVSVSVSPSTIMFVFEFCSGDIGPLQRAPSRSDVHLWPEQNGDARLEVGILLSGGSEKMVVGT